MDLHSQELFVQSLMPKSKSAIRLNRGRKVFPDKLRLWGLIQADDSSQWIAAEVLAQSRHEAVMCFNKHYGYPQDTLVGHVLVGTEQDCYLRCVELGGLQLEYVKQMTPHEVRETWGLFQYEEED